MVDIFKLARNSSRQSTMQGMLLLSSIQSSRASTDCWKIFCLCGLQHLVRCEGKSSLCLQQRQ
jgi:hypothetical protein